MSIHFIKTPEKRRIIAQLKEQFGIEKLSYLLIESGKEKIRGYSGSLSKDEISKLSELANIEIIGSYLARKEKEEFRLSFDATQILSSQISRNIIKINESQFREWMLGHNLEINSERGICVLKFGNDFVGCGKSSSEKIFNYVPKDRRLRK